MATKTATKSPSKTGRVHRGTKTGRVRRGTGDVVERRGKFTPNKETVHKSEKIVDTQPPPPPKKDKK